MSEVEMFCPLTLLLLVSPPTRAHPTGRVKKPPFTRRGPYTSPYQQRLIKGICGFNLSDRLSAQRSCTPKLKGLLIWRGR